LKAVILVGGLGTRLRPLTWHTPKALVPVLNRPFLEHVLARLKEHGVGEIILAISNLAEEIEARLGDGSRLRLKISYASEKTALGTAGAVRNASEYLADSFFVLNGDTYSDLDFSAMLRFHHMHHSRVTIALTPVEDPTQYGLIETEIDGRVKRFLEKPKKEEITTNMINAGTYILEPEVLDLIPRGQEYSFERQLFPGMLAGGEPVYAFPSEGYWIDIGSPEKYMRFNFDLLAGKSGNYGFKRGNEVVVGNSSKVAAGANLMGPILIGEGCIVEDQSIIEGPAIIGDGCQIGREAAVKSSILWDNVTLDEKSHVSACIIANDCRLGKSANLQGVVSGDHATFGRGVSVQSGTRIQPGETIGH
jgi:mannose-1-phosphate guanylyltransferase